MIGASCGRGLRGAPAPGSMSPARRTPMGSARSPDDGTTVGSASAGPAALALGAGVMSSVRAPVVAAVGRSATRLDCGSSRWRVPSQTCWIEYAAAAINAMAANATASSLRAEIERCGRPATLGIPGSPGNGEIRWPSRPAEPGRPPSGPWSVASGSLMAGPRGSMTVGPAAGSSFGAPFASALGSAHSMAGRVAQGWPRSRRIP